MKKGKLIAGAAITAVCAVFLVRTFSPKQFAQAVALPIVSTETPATGDIRLTTSVIGEIEPSDVVYIYPKASGDITSVNVKAGDVVEQGQLLCTIDTKQVETAKSNLDSASLSLKEANEELARQQILYASGGISNQAYTQYQNNVENAKIQYDQAKYNYETQLEYSQITAPISGVVEISDMEVHDTVSANNLICVVSGQGERVVSFSTTERIADYLSVGDGVEVEKDGKIYDGVIYEISTMADTQTGLYKVKASLDAKESLPTGSKVTLTVVSQSAEQVMTVPSDAVYYENGSPYVYVCQDHILHKQFIETGIMGSGLVEVQSGLDMEAQVVTTWSSELYDGAEVRVSGSTAGADEQTETRDGEVPGGSGQGTSVEEIGSAETTGHSQEVEE